MRELFEDLRHALRRLRRRPGFTCLAVTTLALACGIAVAFVAVLDALVLRPLPVRAPRELVAVSVISAGRAGASMSLDAFAELERRQSALDGLTALISGGLVTTVLHDEVGPRVTDGVSGRYFDLLGLAPALGRFLDVEDVALATGTPAPVAVISYGVWQREFGGRPDVIGRTIRAGDVTLTVVGVAPAGFDGVQVGNATDVVIPITLVPRVLGLGTAVPMPVPDVLGRLTRGTSIGQARAHLDSLWPDILRAVVPPTLSSAQRDEFLGRRLIVRSASTGISFWRERFGGPLQLLIGLAGWMLLIACGNLASLFAADVVARHRDCLTLRALGAPPWRLARQVIVESLLVAALGTTAGIVLAFWSAPALVAVYSVGTIPLALDVRPTGLVAAVAVTMTAVVALLFGALPAWLATHGGATGERSTPAARWVDRLLVTQVALSVVLLAASHGFAWNLWQLRFRDPGFQPDQVALLALFNRPGGYVGLDDNTYYPQLAERLLEIPGVTGAAFAKPTPGGGAEWPQDVSLDGPGPRGAPTSASVVVISPGFFNAMRIPVALGRDLSWRDRIESPPVAIVSRTVAERLVRDGHLLGQRIHVGALPRNQSLEVIGIAEDARVLDVHTDRAAIVYVSMLQQPPPFARWPASVVRTAGDLDATFGAARQVVADMGREYVFSATSLARQIDRSLVKERVLAGLSSLYAGLAAALVGVGLMGVFILAVVRRTREIGVRVALGASPCEIRRLVLAALLRVVVSGLAVGVPLAFIGARVAERFAILAPWHAWTLAAAVALLLVVSVSVGLVPANRAAALEPASALRAE